MAQFPYTQNTGSLKKFLEKIPTIGIPDKVTQRFLESLGFKSRNDRSIMGVLKHIGFTDESGVPTDTWNKYRNKSRSSIILAESIKNSYSELFSLYSDAHRKDNEAIRDYFSTKTSVGEKALQDIIKTFKALVELANFENIHKKETTDVKEKSEENNHIINKTQIETKSGLTININIELAIPATNDPKTYDLFFSALKKHLLSS